jgi:hypothetical protein
MDQIIDEGLALVLGHDSPVQAARGAQPAEMLLGEALPFLALGGAILGQEMQYLTFLAGRHLPHQVENLLLG